MNFLVMLTTDKYVNVLKDAYKAFYGKDYVEEKQYKNIGYKFIAEFLKNTTPHDSDGTACKNTAKGNSKAISLVNFNKTKDLKETGVGKTDKANLSFPSLEEENTFKGFSGFCYKMYAMVTKNAKYPYTACALVNYITSKLVMKHHGAVYKAIIQQIRQFQSQKVIKHYLGGKKDWLLKMLKNFRKITLMFINLYNNTKVSNLL